MPAAGDSCLRMDAEEVEAADLATRKRRYHEREDTALEEQWEERKRRVLADALAEKQDAKNEETEMEQWAAREERRYWEDRCGGRGRDWASSEEFDPEDCSDCSSLHGSDGVWEELSKMRSAFDEERDEQREAADAWLHPSGDGSVPTAELPLEVPLCGTDGDTDSESDFDARSCRSEADCEGRAFGTVEEACAALKATGDDELHNMRKLGFGKVRKHCASALQPAMPSLSVPLRMA